MGQLSGNALSDEQCEAFFVKLAEAERPLIYAGGGVIHGGLQLRGIKAGLGGGGAGPGGRGGGGEGHGAHARDHAAFRASLQEGVRWTAR
jgi:hypothetical protein